MISQEERARRYRLAADLAQRSEWTVDHHALERAIANDRPRALGYLADYIAGHDGPVNPVLVANRLALAASLGQPDPTFELLTERLTDRWPALRDRHCYTSQVLWGWPGLPRITRHRSTISPGATLLRADMRDAVPAMATVEGWARVKRFFVPVDSPYAPWVSLGSIAAHLAPLPDDPGAVPF